MGVWMARYFFHVTNVTTFKDELGRRFSDPVDAKAKELTECWHGYSVIVIQRRFSGPAIANAHAEVIAKELAECWDGYSVVVIDEHGTEIARVPIED
jgi:hypothetical protein